MARFICDCGHEESAHSNFTRGYGTSSDGKTACYACCTEQDKQYMRDHGKITLYLNCPPIPARQNPYNLYVDGTVGNWTMDLAIPARVKRNRNGHNWGLTRYDAWFVFEGKNWHGVLYGENTQLIHCRQLKN